MWIVVVAGGWLGILSPTMEFTTLAEKLMPKGLQNNELVYTLIHPKVAEVQTFLGYDVPRPQAPFDFSNNWGANFALLLPFVCAFWGQMRTLTRRNLLRLVAVGSLVPVVFSLNRTLWLCPHRHPRLRRRPLRRPGPEGRLPGHLRRGHRRLPHVQLRARPAS